MMFACFGGAAAVADEAAAVSSRRRHRHRHRRGKFLFGSKGEKSPSKMSPGRREACFDLYDMIAAGKLSSSSSASSALSTAASLDSACSSSSSSCSSSSSRSSSSSSLLMLEATHQLPANSKEAAKRSPAAGAAAVLVCLLMMMFCGRFAATMLTAAALCFFPRLWPASAAGAKAAEGVLSSPEFDAAAAREDSEAVKTKAVAGVFLLRNRNK